MQIFEQMGIKVQLARSTEEALSRIRDTNFDLIISDMGRGQDPKAGITLLTELRDAKVNTPVIIYASETAVDRYGQEAIAAGAVEVIAGVTEILSAVKRFLVSDDRD